MNSSKCLHERHVREGQGPEPVDATVKDDNGPLPPTFLQTAVDGMEGGKRSHILSLCGQLRLALIPCHIRGELCSWIRSTAISYAAELDGHVLSTLCAITMALLTNRLDLCIQGLFGAGKSKTMAILILALLELDDSQKLRILFLCKENSGTKSFADLLLWLDPHRGCLAAYRGGPHIRSLISIDFPAPEMEPESAHVVSAVSVP